MIALAALIRRDIRIALRVGGGALIGVLFFLIVVVLMPFAIGRYSFARQDAAQWAAWGFDYLKYDWGPNEIPETEEMAPVRK